MAAGVQERKNLFWTSASGCVYALSSVVFLMVVSHVLGDTAAGVYATASMVALQLMTLGKYSVRNFQVSDVREEYTFSEYFSFRMITCGMMLASLFGWILLMGYHGEIMVSVICFTIYKMGEAVSDVFEARLQQQSELARGSKIQMVMNLTLIAVFLAGILITKNLTIAMAGLAIASVAILFIIYIPMRKYFADLHWQMSRKTLKGLLRACFALFLGSFLYSLMNNAPRFAIEFVSDLDDRLIGLGCFSQLFMPVFAVELLAGFSMRTWMEPMAKAVAAKDMRLFCQKYYSQIGVVVALTVVAMVFAFFLGCPVLGWFYKSDLSEYPVDLMLLMLAGGFVAIQTLFENVLILYRGQKYSIPINLITIGIGMVLTYIFTCEWYIRGAVYGYLLMTGLRALIFWIVSFWYRNHKKNEK